ncbi:hypothetical protein C8J57DRAFT_1453676 [Mycena rebaudengoi]|nr:hypothetical protein C8J57DRAFT_1453676 [Mycena rebaudengoi]
MAVDPPLLESVLPNGKWPTAVKIGHVQLRDVLICPRERGVVNYVQDKSIVEHRLLSSPRTLVSLAFSPNTLASLPIPDTDHHLLAAGGQEAEIHLSLLDAENMQAWQVNTRLQGSSINNSILLTSLSLTDSNESSVEPRMVVSNNDCTVKFFDVPVRARPSTIPQVGSVRFNVPVNHSSISPDGRTLLSVGDSSKVHLHRITGGSHLAFSPLATHTLPPTSPFTSRALAASFSTAFSADGSKYAVAAQEGAVVVWDVRSTRPLKVFQTDKERGPPGADDPAEWQSGRSHGPGWSARNVKFGGSPGREVMVFTEHTSLIHVIDARTFETEEILRMPDFPPPPPRPRAVSSASASYPRYAATTIPRGPLSPLRATARADILRTLEATFRVVEPPEGDADTDGDGDAMILELGDRAVEREVRRVLAQRHRIDEQEREEGQELEMEEQEEGRFSARMRVDEEDDDDEEEEEEEEEHRLRRASVNPDAHRNLAGTCFDPTGAWIYVASERGVAEWGVRGAGKRWWSGGAWER